MIYKEVENNNPLYVSVLDNGVLICVYGDYAEGSDGNIYKHVGEEVDEDEMITIGWECVTGNQPE